MEIPERYLTKIDREVHYCQFCQPQDDESDDGIFWVLGDRIGFVEYLEYIGLPKKYYEELDGVISCKYCGYPLTLDMDVGLKTKYEIEYEKKFDHVASKIIPSIKEFSEYLGKYPYLGHKHKIGKRICREIESLDKIDIKNETWFRGRKINQERVFTNSDMQPPDPNKVVIGEGRFNHYGQSHYYLGDSQELCAVEIECTNESICWIQELNINVENIIDLTTYINSDNIDSIPIVFVGIMIAREISKKVKKESTWKPEYFIARYIADVCKEIGINGIKYNSSIHHGSNLVIFNFEKLEMDFKGEPNIYTFKKEDESKIMESLLADLEF